MAAGNAAAAKTAVATTTPTPPTTTSNSPTDDKWLKTVAEAQAAAKAQKATDPATSTSDTGGEALKKLEKLNNVELISGSAWEVFLPPPSNSFKGKVVPRVVNRFAKRRKVSLEVHKVTPLTKEVDDKGNEVPVKPFEECVLRILQPSDRQKNAEVRREAFQKIRQHEGNNEDFGADEDFDDEATVMTDHGKSSRGLTKKHSFLADSGGKHFEGWDPRYRFPCKAVSIESQHKNSIYLLIRVEDIKQERELIFDTVEDATAFREKLSEERHSETVRAKSRLDSTLGSIKLAPFEKLSLLFEIVSGWDLPIGDLNTSDPYVICMLGRREVHRTKHIPGTLDPIWTVKSDSLFLLEVTSEELFIEDGMKFLVKDFDQFGSNETLGLVHVPPKTLYHANGERLEFKLQAVPGKTADEVPGHIAIRCRRASTLDKEFMEGFESSMRAVAAPKAPKVKNNAIKSMVTKTQKVEDGVKKYKVRPRPDPKRKEETEWMTKEEIAKEVMKPSHSWIDAGTGKLGRVFLEVLSAEGLPNLDTGSWLGNLTDSFVSIVHEDTFVRTDTIDDCLNPVWLPWSSRAFILNIAHASSQIFLGVFDFDAGFDPHDLIGRVSVDITNLRPNTEYYLSYNIYPSARVTGRESQGKINLRLRLEIPDERKLALSALEPPPPTYVNVKRGKDFKVVRQTCLGAVDVDKYSISTLKSYVEELREYQNVLFYLEDAVMAVLLWRGHFSLTLGKKKLLLPLHSINAFILATLLVENPQLYPSFLFASIAWLMIAIMGWRRNNPDEWSSCHSFIHILEQVLRGKSSTPPHSIKPFEGFEKAKAAMEKWMKRLADAEEAAQRQYIEAQKEEAERLKELEEIGEADADLSTKVGGGISIDPIKAALHPVQLLLGVVCRGLRVVKHVLYWEDSFLAFWITAASAFLAIACYFVPWFFIIKWTSRLVVWTVFGPWMKLVDVFYVSKMKPETNSERVDREKREKLARHKATAEALSQARQIRENTSKMKQMKKIMFGKFAMKVPIMKEDRYVDTPLPQSFANPYQQKALTLAELAMQEAGYNRTRLPGQTLVGDMIPRVETETLTIAPTGKATASPQKLSRSTPGGGLKNHSESTTTAYAYIGSIVTVAGIVTFFGVPILASLSDMAIQKFRS